MNTMTRTYTWTDMAYHNIGIDIEAIRKLRMNLCDVKKKTPSVLWEVKGNVCTTTYDFMNSIDTGLGLKVRELIEPHN